MRRALAVLAVIGLIAVGAWAYTRPSDTVAAPSPSPTPVVAPATASATATPPPPPSPSPTATGVPFPTFAPALSVGDVKIGLAAARPSSADVSYLVVQGDVHWVTLLDLSAKQARTVAEVAFVRPPGAPREPSVRTSWTADGRRLLLTVTDTAGRMHLVLVDVEHATARALRTVDAHPDTVISPDGSRFAFSDMSADPARRGVWIGDTGTDAVRRVIADDPQRVTGPPSPLAFSPDGTQLAVRVDFNAGDTGIAIVRSDPPAEARVDPATRTVTDSTFLERGSDFDWLGAPEDAWAWEGVTHVGGVNTVYAYDLRTGSGTVVYKPVVGFILQEMRRSPRLDRFVTVERGGVIGEARGAITVRTRAGAATKVADVTLVGPSRVWWSPDGSRLYAIFGGDDSVGGVGDLLSDEGILNFCVRAPTAPGFVCP